MFKRIVLFLVTNLAIMLTLTVIWQIVVASGVIRNTEVLGSYGPLMAFSVLFGFGGAFISLLLSKYVAKWMTGAQVIEAPRNADEAWLLDTVRRHADRAGIGMPEVAIYDSPEMNAFATGATRNHALVAVSTGLLRSMDRQQVDAVLGHEITHVENGDMVTLTLIQGVLNTFVIFLSRVIGSLIDGALRGRNDRERGGGFGYFITVMILQSVLGLLATLIVAWFSRRREYRADRGGATLASTAAMVSALRRLGQGEETGLPKAMAAFGISGGGLVGLLRTHPPIEERIRALQEQRA
ncbi:MAG TPA: protease HtpX [Polyangiaceae bacterium]|nr:protease HtpX [Polyangiaceae bacterium]